MLALISVACWAWYALRNARWLRENPDKHPMMWATAQALVTLPVSLIGYAAVCLWLSIQKPLFTLPFWPASRAVYRSDDRHRGAVFLGGRAVLEYRQPKLPTVILGPLIVFETLAGLLYTFILRQEIPPFLTLSGIALLVAGVVIAVRAKPEKATVVPVTER
ncbi:membrane protein [Salmonella enterica subsp. enterica]|nr:membrane protein [Salmonella enterica subsp. enterica]